jgi:small subunit ribosomal protein S6
MAKYEVMFIVRPDVTEEDLEKVIAQMESTVSATGGKVEKVEKMGRRRLAYRVSRFREGLYVLFTLEGGDTVKEFERRLKVSDAVIKFLTVRIDEELERAEKWKAWRAKQVARKPKSAAAQGAEMQPIPVKE